MSADLSIEEPRRAPASVIAVVVLTYIVGVLDILAGILVILLRYADDIDELGGQLPITLIGASTLLLGLLTIAIASGLSRGDWMARVAATVIFGITLVIGVLALVVVLLALATGTAVSTSTLVATIVEVVLVASVIVALYIGPAARYFARASIRA
ncbi:hypothetical protein [Subtercola endophyticus]|uniref:hypothetical protein n=1 Tax=Subtercola endophyticus TaxID=2895559 RepID=UPI001E2B8FEB|nr:hypothetical protein [Subtercola endophyticus]UFS59831.1 hypothetical protein LQ955_03280 [Subtercola endophyticus]